MSVLYLLLFACTGDPADDSGHPGPALSLAELVDEDALVGRLEVLQALADTHGDRLATSEGEAAARDWARTELEGMGWTVEEPAIPWGVPLRHAANLVARSPFGTADEVVALGAHLDTVLGTAGMNDNATGVAAVLGLAEALVDREDPPLRQVQVILFTREEDWRLGSYSYVQDLDFDEALAMRAFLNVDMIGSPNGFPMVMDGAGFGGAVAEGGATLSTLLGGALDAAGVPWAMLDASLYSDHIYFIDRGIPVAWVHSGGEDEKTEEQAAAWGGQAGASYDACYHTPCDRLDNVDVDIVMALTRAVAETLEALADGEAL